MDRQDAGERSVPRANPPTSRPGKRTGMRKRKPAWKPGLELTAAMREAGWSGPRRSGGKSRYELSPAGREGNLALEGSVGWGLSPWRPGSLELWVNYFDQSDHRIWPVLSLLSVAMQTEYIEMAGAIV